MSQSRPRWRTRLQDKHRVRRLSGATKPRSVPYHRSMKAVWIVVPSCRRRNCFIKRRGPTPPSSPVPASSPATASIGRCTTTLACDGWAYDSGSLAYWRSNNMGNGNSYVVYIYYTNPISPVLIARAFTAPPTLAQNCATGFRRPGLQRSPRGRDDQRAFRRTPPREQKHPERHPGGSGMPTPRASPDTT